MNKLNTATLLGKDTGQILKSSNPHRSGLGLRADYSLGPPGPTQPSPAQAPHCLETGKNGREALLGKEVRDSSPRLHCAFDEL